MHASLELELKQVETSLIPALRMDQVAPMGRRLPRSGYSDGDGVSQCPQSAVPQPFFSKTSSSYNVFIVMTYASTYFSLISAQGVANFFVEGTSYNCTVNIMCLGDAQPSKGQFGTGGIKDGTLSLVDEWNSFGIAYYNQQVKLLDLSSNQSASFNTSFTLDVRNGKGGGRGDGMTFLLSANNSFTGWTGGSFGIFDGSISYATPFKSVVVEFDTNKNSQAPINDINDNHVSFDFVNITATAVADANSSEVSATDHVDLGDENTKYVWVEYSRDTLNLEVRVSYDNSRPISPLLYFPMNLFDFVEEYMWVGFSSGTGDLYSNFYIGDWSFESSGIPVPSPGPASPPATPGTNPPPTREKSGGNKLGIIVGISVGFVIFLLLGVTVIIVFVRHRRSGGHFGCAAFTREDPMLQIEGMPERFSYKQLSVATRGFSVESKLGQGGFGSVYRGVLPSSGIPVAVKKISSDSNQGEKEFVAEVSIISRLRHRNLIQLQGWCKDTSQGKYLVVYELMSNASLDKVLFDQPTEGQLACLSWAQRFNIVTGTAAALDYLHQGWKQQVIHRDIKSSNIMLDEEWNAKLGDFGLARLVDHTSEAATTVVAGTLGYLAPEAATTGRFTDKTDVFAFGAVVLEIACGRKAFSTNFPREKMILVDWVWESLSKGALLSTVDERLEDYDTYWMEVVLIVGLSCSHPNPLARPSMRQVVQVLSGDVPVPSIPTSQPTPFSSDPDIIATDHYHGPTSGSSSNSRSGSTSLVSLSNSNSTQMSSLKS